MAFCSKCGREVLDGENYCPGCGTAVSITNSINASERTITKDESCKRLSAIWGILSLVLAIAVTFSISISPWIHFGLTVLVLIIVVVCFAKHVKLYGFALLALAVVVFNFSAYLFMYAVPDKNMNTFSEAEEKFGRTGITNNASNTWQEYIKTDEFGDTVKKTKADPRYYAEFVGTGKTSINENDFDATLAIGLTDSIEYSSEKRGERIVIVPVYTAGAKMLSITQKGYIKAKSSDGGKLEGDASIESDRFIISDYTLFFSNHLMKGDNIQVVVGTSDGSYQFSFTMTSDNFSEIHKIIEEKDTSDN